MNDFYRKSNKLNIGIDLDGTVTAYDYWLRRANKFFGRSIRPEEISDYSITQVLGITREDFMSFYRLHGEALHRDAEIRPEAARVITKMAAQCHIHYISAREPILWRVSMEWLIEHRLPIDSLSLLGSPHKLRRAQELGCDLFFEDSLDNALELANSGILVLMIDCPYNQGPLPRGIVRVKDWSQVDWTINYLLSVPPGAPLSSETSSATLKPLIGLKDLPVNRLPCIDRTFRSA